MINRISSEYVPRMKVLIFADFMYFPIVIVENTQAQYFDNYLFLATFSKPVLVFVRITKWKSEATYRFERVLFTVTYSLFHSNM